MGYLDGFVLAVPVAKRDAYREIAARASEVFRAHGALRVVEAWGHDVPEGTTTSFTMAVRRQPDEAVVFSWIEWPSREARDAGHAAAMADPRMPMDMAAMPFDGKRMIFGGFEPIVDR
jgi:uncharacterized protein YbaA (DUF1428 family)